MSTDGRGNRHAFICAAVCSSGRAWQQAASTAIEREAAAHIGKLARRQSPGYPKQTIGCRAHGVSHGRRHACGGALSARAVCSSG